MDLTSYAELAVLLVNGELPDENGLREELTSVFALADAGKHEEAVELLNALLARHPVHPHISAHDGQGWHLHLAEGGLVMGLAAVVTDLGVDRLGVCRAARCANVFVDTSSNRSRRYCSERCASRANVAAYRARRRNAP
ncbi:CGNR zinc finger domain-containing protein [Nonomuraea sp. NPDC003804]|uniref:CGNR zinc finger domain-containing protein n=1 Tax=Nonomuraea sp. NPDC003804 TaxID=3154547 RepID=UPI0033BBCB2E